MDDESPKLISEAVEEVGPGDQTWDEHLAEMRADAEAIIDAWLDLVADETGVILVPIGVYFHLAQPLRTCEKRIDIDNDPFESTEELLTAASLVRQLKAVEEGDATSVFAHVDDVPLTHGDL